jgi:hypothetical protein
MNCLSKRATKTVVAILSVVTMVVTYAWHTPGLSWLGTFFVSALMVFGMGAMATFFGVALMGLWRASRPKRLHFGKTERSLARLGRLAVALALLAVALWVSWRTMEILGPPWGNLLLLAAVFCFPTVVWRLKHRVRDARIAAPAHPRQMKVLWIPFDDREIRELPSYKHWNLGRPNPLQIATSMLPEVSAWHFPFPDFELYEAFRDEMKRGDKRLLSVGPLSKISDRQAKRLAERASQIDLPCVLVESGSMALADAIFIETTGAGLLDELEIIDYQLEEVIFELRSQLPDDHYLLISYGFRWPLTIIASWPMLMQLKENQSKFARAVREALTNASLPSTEPGNQQ